MCSLLLLLPLFGIIVLNLLFRNLMRKLALPFVLALSALQVILVLYRPAQILNAPEYWQRFFKLPLFLDNLTLVLLLSIGIVVFCAVLVGEQTISNLKQRFNFLNLILVSMIGMNGTVLTQDIFSLYVFLEITAVSSFILIALQRNLNAMEGAFKYIILSAVATIMLLASIALLLLVAGDTSFAGVSAAIADSSQSPLVLLAMAIFVCGLFIKGGLVPFHGWLPAAYSAAPAGVSVLLAGIVTKVSGIYALIRLATSVFGSNASVNQVLMIAGAISIVIGAFAAIGQNDFKRMLAYSSISQVGYIVLALGCGTKLAIVGAVFHLFNHSIFKSLLFVNSAAVEQQLGTTDMNKMGALGSKMPITNITSLIAFLSTAGVPPLAGFWSKLIIVIALWQSAYYFYAYLAIILGVVTLAYLLLMQRKVFFGIPAANQDSVKEGGFGIVLPALILAAITLGVGIFFPFLFNSFIIPIESFLK